MQLVCAQLDLFQCHVVLKVLAPICPATLTGRKALKRCRAVNNTSISLSSVYDHSLRQIYEPIGEIQTLLTRYETERASVECFWWGNLAAEFISRIRAL